MDPANTPPSPTDEPKPAGATTLADLVRAAPDLMEPDNLPRYCDAVNRLAHGYAYHVIHDADGYRAKYESRLQAEDPSAPWQEGVPRLSDFGVCDTAEIKPPSRQNGSVIFYVEDDYLGIPYRVTAPAPEQPEGEISYEPLPMSPLPRPAPT